jgi:uncharacterized protein YndB with AHSA1/START domain
MILKVAIVIAVIVAAILIFAASKPDTFHMQRTRSVHAPPEKIFPFINDFHNWSRWAPQDKEDSTMVRSFSGPASGEGAASEWTSKGGAGKGRMRIIESVPSTKILVKVDFTAPFEAHNINQFVLEPQGSDTIVTWSMQGTNLYVMKLMSIFVNMDRVAGRHFETGLDNLKVIAEQ